jgi:hypothetical protein
MSKVFDLEQQIMECWQVTDDLSLIYASVCDSNISKDTFANILLGMKEIYALKFERLFETFEDVTKEFHAAKSTKNQKLKGVKLETLYNF